MHGLPRGNTIQFRIPGDPKYVSMVRKAVQTLAGDLGFPDDVIWDIEVAVAEALANAVEHGSPDHNADSVVLTCKFGDGKLTIDVRDEGPVFDLPRADEQTGCMNERGRGLRMIYELMDDVQILRSGRGSKIRMVKEVHALRTSADGTGQVASCSM